jgi:hypothetical protein
VVANSFRPFLKRYLCVELSHGSVGQIKKYGKIGYPDAMAQVIYFTWVILCLGSPWNFGRLTGLYLFTLLLWGGRLEGVSLHWCPDSNRTMRWLVEGGFFLFTERILLTWKSIRISARTGRDRVFWCESHRPSGGPVLQNIQGIWGLGVVLIYSPCCRGHSLNHHV